jgi:hypothetical protein
MLSGVGAGVQEAPRRATHDEAVQGRTASRVNERERVSTRIMKVNRL